MRVRVILVDTFELICLFLAARLLLPVLLPLLMMRR